MDAMTLNLNDLKGILFFISSLMKKGDWPRGRLFEDAVPTVRSFSLGKMVSRVLPDVKRALKLVIFPDNVKAGSIRAPSLLRFRTVVKETMFSSCHDSQY